MIIKVLNVYRIKWPQTFKSTFIDTNTDKMNQCLEMIIEIYKNGSLSTWTLVSFRMIMSFVQTFYFENKCANCCFSKAFQVFSLYLMQTHRLYKCSA